jgi:hypothetical protein
MKLRALNKVMVLAVLMTISLNAVAADVPLAADVEADQIVTNVLAVDAAKHQVVLEGPEGRQVHIQLTNRAKDLGNLKVGDQVNVEVIHSVAAYLDTSVDEGLPENSETVGDVRATKNNPTPEGEAYRQVRVQLKITDINLDDNQLTFENPAGMTKVVNVERPEIQAKLKDLKVGQSVRVTYTDILKVTSKH